MNAKNHEAQLLRFITGGSVDDGKSTLIGRLLVDSRAVLQDQLAGVQSSAGLDSGLRRNDGRLVTPPRSSPE